MRFLLKTLFALFFLFSLSPFLTKPSLADIGFLPAIPDTFANNHGTNPNGIPDESTWKVTLKFTGLVGNKDYWVCGEYCNSPLGGSEPSANIKSDSSGNLTTYNLCASNQSSLVWSDCDEANYFHAGNKYKVNLFDKEIGHSLNPKPIYTADFYVQRFYPAVTTSSPSNNKIQFQISGTRRRHDDVDRNNYSIFVKSQTGGGYEEDNCAEVEPSNPGTVLFENIDRPGKYIAEIWEETQEGALFDPILRTCNSGQGFLYYTITFKVNSDGSISDISNPLKDPEGDDTSALVGKNPCQPTGSGPVVCPTALGEIPANPKEFVDRILTLATGLAGGIALIFMVIGSIKVLTSSGDQQKLNAGKDQIVAAVAGLLFLIFSVLILRFFGLALQIPFV